MAFEKDGWNEPDEILRRFDTNEDGALDYEEFKTLCDQLFGQEEVADSEDRIHDIFDILDADGDGLLNEDEWLRCHKEWISVIINPVNALLVIDVQNDFIDGTLALKNCDLGEDGGEIVEPINRLLKEDCWKKIVYTLDWHPETHIGFYENLHMRELHPESEISKEDAKPFDTVRFVQPDLEQVLWPRHCVMDSWGAELHKDLFVAEDSVQVRKGQKPDMDAYSGFFDNAAEDSTELLGILNDNGITDVYVCGLALDVCVKATCLDGLRLGFRLAVVEDLCRGVDCDGVEEARKSILANGGLVTNANNVLSFARGVKRSLVMAQQAACTLAKKWSGDEHADDF
ncbi:nicotinamidase-like [Venturia canescens]|uniref:nicotinamidase-like n=1 Tax=Venturia canescens TaxID=32260 RepID=UPI001C9D0A6C|nr:nicotinamidase-like [Venturia canescens]